ncbi:hydrogen peroxide-dependent heme synthase [Aquisphaera insulae]|uniref:hydrogen peroxide-dependent heme synthase n=1 Tax=Aquisphaera insulae TaxID=2712864 RepID=UPI0013E9A9E7|nr:hydrogen peroxide-dependent heme synthase [Aquisphaera insulae]
MSHDPSNPATHGPQAAPRAQPTHGHRPGASQQTPATLVPETGWHFLHLFYRIDRERLHRLDAERREAGRRDLLAALAARAPGSIEQLQCFAVPGHKADFGVVLAGPDLKAVHGVQMAIQASALGPAIVPAYSFYSLTEVSEYVPDAEEYGRILRERENVDPESPTYKAKVAAYSERLGPMNRQRLTPDFPDWPCLCFYPMSKMRSGDQNWYLLPFEERSELMAQHGRSGMKFAGKVSQVITASTGLDDWEWGVTLWGRNPLYLKDIVYTMRFDESSAKYALFGDFYFGYLLPPEELLETIRL